jgi:hypothetical protein
MIEHVDVDPLAVAELVPPVGLSSGPLGAVQAADREIGRQTALRARAVAAFTETRPSAADRPQGQKGAMSAERWAARAEVLRPVSEWAAQELSVGLSITASTAETLMERSLTLVHRLPGTLAALEAGLLHAGHLFAMLEKVAPIEDDAVRTEVETLLLRWASGRVTTPAQLGAKARREVLKRDARAAARALEQAIAKRGVFWSPGRVDGMGAVTAALTLPECRVLMTVLGACADAIEDEPGAPPRTREQKMADVLMDLVVRPGETEVPPVQVVLTLVATVATVLGGDAPGEVDGHPVPAEMVRGLLRGLTGADLTHPALFPDDGGWDDGQPWESPPPDPDEYAAYLAECADFELWQEQFDARLAAGEFTDNWPPDQDCPSPGAAAETNAAAETLAPEAAVRVADGPEEPSAYQQAAEEPVAEPPVDDWWARADRALDDASRAQVAADLALGHAGALVRTAAAWDAGDEHEWATGRGGRISAAEDAMTALLLATTAQREELGRLLARAGGGGLAERPRIAVTSAVTGALLSLTDLPGLRRVGRCDRPGCRRRPDTCPHDLTDRPGLGPPEATDGYRPAADLDRFVRARDRRCRFPGCRRPVPRTGELDHDTAYPDGPTAAANLAGYCTANHRGKHQARGWRHELHPDGRLTIATPTGLTTTTDPPPY